MNRTNEFNHLITSFEAPQKSPSLAPPDTGLSAIADEIDKTLGRLEKKGEYERHVADQKIKKVAALLERYRTAAEALKASPQNENEGTHLRNLKEMVAHKYARMMVRYKSFSKRRSEKAATDTKRREAFSYAEQEQSQLVLEEKQENSEVMRKRMTSQMNELGQIVTDISLQVSLQGEEIRRIDELVTASEGFIKDSFFEINRVWEGISERRKRMFKFFGFWVFMALMFWYFRRH